MVELRTGYCPVHDREVTIKVKYSEMRVIGTTNVQKKYWLNSCPVWDPKHSECSDCPVARGSASETP